jgi:hypothetical protein
MCPINFGQVLPTAGAETFPGKPFSYPRPKPLDDFELVLLAEQVEFGLPVTGTKFGKRRAAGFVCETSPIFAQDLECQTGPIQAPHFGNFERRI